MLVKRLICSFAVGCAVLMSVGCKTVPKDDFVDIDMPQPIISEDIVMKTVYPEYDGGTEKIFATVVNNSDNEFGYGAQFFLQKLDEGEWRYISVSGYWKGWASAISPKEDGKVGFDLKDHAKLPLLPGTYRIGFSGECKSTPVAEFIVK